jgi:PPOX class probable F420-dependent enzyme
MEVGKLKELPAWARELIYSSRVARLGFLDADDKPRVLPVTYALYDDALWTAIDRKPKRPGEPARVRYLRRRPEAAMIADRYSDDWSQLAWVQALGRVQIVPAQEAEPAVAALTAKYEPYVLEEPPGPLLRLVPDRILCWAADIG